MSFAIFNSEMAIVFNNPDSADCASCAARASNLFGAPRGRPVMVEISAAMLSPNPGGEFNPVPTAVPPMASSSK